MKKLRILEHPNKSLRKECKSVKKLTAARRDKIRQMFDIMYQNNGMGLAAPQVGWNERVFIMNVTGCKKDELVFINPVIVEQSGDMIDVPEGCLSLPGFVGIVTRHLKAAVRAQNEDGIIFTLTDEAWAARCMLHEIDHLDGILIIDKAKKLYRGEDTL